MLFLSLTGALLVCPMSLLAEMPNAALRLMGFALPEQAAGALDASLFLPCLLASGVLAPICEELFFRGYLMGVFADSDAGEPSGVLHCSLRWRMAWTRRFCRGC